jgi:hypothetical protein
MTILEKISKLKQTLEVAQKAKNKAEGAASQILSQLEQEFEINSIKEAEKELIKLNNEIERLEKGLSIKIKEFNNKWGDKLESIVKN